MVSVRHDRRTGAEITRSRRGRVHTVGVHALMGVRVSESGSRWLSVTEAAEHTGLSRRTVQRRVDAWLDGDRSPYAIRGRRHFGRGTTGVDPTEGERQVDELDAERVRVQLDGELDPAVTADAYLEQQRGE